MKLSGVRSRQFGSARGRGGPSGGIGSSVKPIPVVLARRMPERGRGGSVAEGPSSSAMKFMAALTALSEAGWKRAPGGIAVRAVPTMKPMDASSANATRATREAESDARHLRRCVEAGLTKANLCVVMKQGKRWQPRERTAT